MKAWGKIKSLDNISHRIGRLEDSKKIVSSNNNTIDNGVPYATAEELEHMTAHQYYEARFNWRVKEILPLYKLEVMRLHNITSDEEYNRLR